MSLAHVAWFSVVSLVFSTTTLRDRMLKAQKAFNRTIGSVLVALGVSLGLAR
ncbi:hypothetical protein [Streptomyces sp. NPDC048496]|uniref:hypothetical protein n=1 Tax=Streptomyces sp. NPDC048496 TaxID=3365558 RepID=UPI0037161CDA